MTVRPYSTLLPQRSPPLASIPVPRALRSRLGPSLHVDDCYCPIPDCACQRAVLRLWTEDERAVAVIDVALRPPGPEEPFEQIELERDVGQGPHAGEVLALLRGGGLDEALLDALAGRWSEVKQTAQLLADRDLLATLDSRPRRRADAKVGRNQLCACGSGRKYKRCCLRDEAGLRAVAARFADEGRAEQARWDAAVAEELVEQWRVESAPLENDEPRFPGVHPYLDATRAFRLEPTSEQEREEQEGPGSPAWLRGQSTGELGELLAEYGVRDGLGRFEELSRDAWFAFDVAERWMADGTQGSASHQLGLIAVELWRRRRPDEPCFELLFERMEEGYDVLEDDDVLEASEQQVMAACEAWWAVWEGLAPRLAGEVVDLWDAHEVFPSFRVMQDWWWDLSTALEVASEAQPEWTACAFDFHRDTLELLPAEEPSLLARCWDAASVLHIQSGDKVEAERFLRRGIELYPEEPRCAVRLAELLARSTGGEVDPGGAAQAVELLRQARRRAAEHDTWRIDALLQELEPEPDAATPTRDTDDV